MRRAALVLTISDGVAAGARVDESGQALAERLGELGFTVARAQPGPTGADDEIDPLAPLHQGLRDRTPQTLHGLLDYEIPGFGEQMRAFGRGKTAMADLSRSLAGVLGTTLVVATPGSRGGALDSLAALEPILDHALETLGGRTQHDAAADAPDHHDDPAGD